LGDPSGEGRGSIADADAVVEIEPGILDSGSDGGDMTGGGIDTVLSTKLSRLILLMAMSCELVPDSIDRALSVYLDQAMQEQQIIMY
jgi:hypothetical protein